MRLLVKPSTSLKLVCGRKLVARAIEQSVKCFWEEFVVLLCNVFLSSHRDGCFWNFRHNFCINNIVLIIYMYCINILVFFV